MCIFNTPEIAIYMFPKFTSLSTFCFVFHSTLGQGLLTSTYPGEVMFSIVIAIMGLVLFALLIGNMQVNKKFAL